MKKINLYVGIGFLLAFVLWTLMVCVVDVQPIGPEGSYVGFATVNGWVHRFLGVHLWLYTLTDALSLIPLAIVAGFGVLGLCQWVKRRSLQAVDLSLFLLGGFYIVTLGAFLLFETVVINYRPILIEGKLEASYPSSTTMLSLCVIPTGMMELRNRISCKSLKNAVLLLLAALLVFLVVGRLLSGVHWFSDILGGMLLSTALVLLYRHFNRRTWSTK